VGVFELVITWDHGENVGLDSAQRDPRRTVRGRHADRGPSERKRGSNVALGIATIVECAWIGRDLEQKAQSYAIANVVPEHLVVRSTGAAMSTTSWHTMTPLKAHSRSHPYPRPAGNHACGLFEVGQRGARIGLLRNSPRVWRSHINAALQTVWAGHDRDTMIDLDFDLIEGGGDGRNCFWGIWPRESSVLVGTVDWHRGYTPEECR
jgi:hypothetical protein